MRFRSALLKHAPAGINPCDERELDLRGYKIPMIENLGVGYEQREDMSLRVMVEARMHVVALPAPFPSFQK